MPPKSNAKKSIAPTSKCRRSRRIAYKIKSMVTGQSASSKKQQSSTKENGKLPNRKKPAAKAQRASSTEELSSTTESEKPTYSQRSMSKRLQGSSKEGQSTSTKKTTVRNGKPPRSQKSASKRQPASSAEGQSTSKKKSAVKKRRVMDEINERVSQMAHEEPEDFSGIIKEISKELLPDFDEISDEAIAEMNIYLNHAFERLARASAILLIGRSDVFMTEKDIETAVVQVVEGDLAKYCVAEGRRAVKKME